LGKKSQNAGNTAAPADGAVEIKKMAFGINGPVDMSVDPLAGTNVSGKYVAPLTGSNSVLSHLWSGTQITTDPDGVITYGFYTGKHAVGIVNNKVNGNGEGPGYTPFTEAQKAAAIASIQLWDDLIPQTFVNVGDVTANEWAQKDATILFANTYTGPGQAWAYYPGSDHPSDRLGSDVWIADPRFNSSNEEFGFGQYGNTTLIHEIGHSLGLTHPGNYNASDDENGDGIPDPITYAADAEYYQDNQLYTIMSYFRAYDVQGFDTAPLDWRYSGGLFYDQSPQGPMIHDIFAIQQVYGADPTTRTGDTTYGFNSNAGNDLFDFTLNPLPYYAIYDAGGDNDTIDASGFASSQYINLNPGSFSSIGDVTMTQQELGQALHDAYLAATGVDLYKLPQFPNATALGALSLSWLNQAKLDIAEAIEADTGVAGIGAVNYDTFGIAYNTIIENAIGGSGRDLLVGNDVANRLEGRAGNDVLQGGAGDDTLVGGAGADTFRYLATDTGADTITDFETGVDDIDLSALNLDASAVHYDADTKTLTIDGTDTSIVILGNGFNSDTDLIL
jgi:serralysin